MLQLLVLNVSEDGATVATVVSSLVTETVTEAAGSEDSFTVYVPVPPASATVSVDVGTTSVFAGVVASAVTWLDQGPSMPRNAPTA